MKNKILSVNIIIIIIIHGCFWTKMIVGGAEIYVIFGFGFVQYSFYHHHQRFFVIIKHNQFERVDF